jgi:hypothetical protein
MSKFNNAEQYFAPHQLVQDSTVYTYPASLRTDDSQESDSDTFDEQPLTSNSTFSQVSTQTQSPTPPARTKTLSTSVNRVKNVVSPETTLFETSTSKIPPLNNNQSSKTHPLEQQQSQQTDQQPQQQPSLQPVSKNFEWLNPQLPPQPPQELVQTSTKNFEWTTPIPIPLENSQNRSLQPSTKISIGPTQKLHILLVMLIMIMMMMMMMMIMMIKTSPIFTIMI